MDFLGVPFGFIMRACYELVASYGFAILLFTLIIKLLMFPLNIWTQKNSIKMIKLKPALNEIEIKYFWDKQRVFKEQSALYKAEKYSTFAGTYPLLIQIVVIIGLMAVIYNPLAHLLQINPEIINAFMTKAQSIEPLTSQLQVINLIKDPNFTEAFRNLSVPGQDVSAAVDSVLKLNLNFFGINLSTVPTFSFSDSLLWIPFAGLVATFGLCLVQNIVNVLQKEAGWFSRWGMTIFLCAFTVYFTFVVPVAVGIYWIFGNLISMLITIVLNIAYNPKKHIDYQALERTKATLNILKAERAKLKPTAVQKAKAKADYTRFFDDSVPKDLVFYSEKSGFYKYLKGYIEYILENSDITIHYITSDYNDAIFKIDNPKIVPYYIDDNRLIVLFMKIKCKVFAMTLMDIELFQLKRSYVKKNIDYVFLCHCMTNTQMISHKNAIANYNTIFTVGPHSVAEYLEEEQIYGIKPRRKLEVGYPLIEELIASYEATEHDSNSIPQILIAPSWQDDNIMDICLDGILDSLKDKKLDIIVRPHPEYVKHSPGKISEFNSKYSDYANIKLEDDFSSNNSIFESDILITDWSTIALDFAFATKKPCISVNTPMKIMNPEYTKYTTPDTNITLRDKVGVSIELDDIPKIGEVVEDLLARSGDYKEIIAEVLNETVFNVGSSAKVGGDYIIARVKGKKRKVVPNPTES